MQRNAWIRSYGWLYKIFSSRISYLRRYRKWLAKDYKILIDKAETSEEKRGLRRSEAHGDWIIIDELQYLRSEKLLRKAYRFDVPTPRMPPINDTDENWSFADAWGHCLTAKAYSDLRKEVREEQDAQRRWWGGWVPTVINALIMFTLIGTLWEAHQDRISAGTAMQKAQAVEKTIIDIALNQIQMSKFQLYGTELLGIGFLFEKEIDKDLNAMLTLIMPDPNERQEWLQSIEDRVIPVLKERGVKFELNEQNEEQSP